MGVARSLLVAAVVAVAFEVAGAQPTVQLRVFVTDTSGQSVRNLGPSDFEIRDNGRVRPVLDVREAAAPLDMLIVLDASSSLIPRFDLMVQAAERLIALSGPGDGYRIGLFSTQLNLFSQTPDRDTLLRAMVAHNQKTRGTALWDVVYTAVTSMAAPSRRRLLVVISDGEDTASRSWSRDDLVRRAQEQDVVIHSIGVRNPAGVLPRPLSPTIDDRSLRIIAEQTGGSFVELTPGLVNSGFAAMSVELRGEYVLTFSPERLDGKSHELAVRTMRSDLRVRTKRRFLAPSVAGAR